MTVILKRPLRGTFLQSGDNPAPASAGGSLLPGMGLDSSSPESDSRDPVLCHDRERSFLSMYCSVLLYVRVC